MSSRESRSAAGAATAPGRGSSLSRGSWACALGLLVVAPWIGSGLPAAARLGQRARADPDPRCLRPVRLGAGRDAVPDRDPGRCASSSARQATAWLLILAFFPLAAAGAAAAAGGGRWRAWPAALLMVCNPFVIDRVRAGHVAVLLGHGDPAVAVRGCPARPAPAQAVRRAPGPLVRAGHLDQPAHGLDRGGAPAGRGTAAPADLGRPGPHGPGRGDRGPGLRVRARALRHGHPHAAGDRAPTSTRTPPTTGRAAGS